VSDEELIDLYRRAWVVASASAREGWGMTITEAAACGTPAVATRIAGHQDAVVDGTSGLLVDTTAGLGAALDRVLSDRAERERLSAGALEHASRFTWEATALDTLAVLADDALRRRARRRTR
jgi:glycosyltransferase involved in cell wall biosynthesis